MVTEGKGDCYEAAVHFMMDNLSYKYRLCHGLVTGKGPMLGKRFGHAWVESSDDPPSDIPDLYKDKFDWTVCIDKSNGLDIELPRDVYYAFGGIYHEEVKRYTREEMLKWMLKTNNYGPWESDGLIIESVKE